MTHFHRRIVNFVSSHTPIYVRAFSIVYPCFTLIDSSRISHKTILESGNYKGHTVVYAQHSYYGRARITLFSRADFLGSRKFT